MQELETAIARLGGMWPSQCLERPADPRFQVIFIFLQESKSSCCIVSSGDAHDFHGGDGAQIDRSGHSRGWRLCFALVLRRNLWREMEIGNL